MGLRERFIERMGGVAEQRLQEVLAHQNKQHERTIERVAADIDKRVSEAYERGFYDGNDDPASGDLQAGGHGYKRISDKYVREGKIDFKRAMNTAWDLWQKSPIAKRVLTMKRDHIIGHKATPSANDDDLLAILTGFWEANSLGKRASEFTMQLFGFGEQCYPVFVRESDGRVLLGYIDPENILQVVKHPDNALEDWAVIVEIYRRGGYSSEKRVYRIIRKDEDYSDDALAMPANYGGKLVTAEQASLQPWEADLLVDCDREAYDGSCFYTKVNAVSNQSRGMSDLLQVADWIDQADEVLFSLADREHMAGYFAFDVTLAGAADEQVKERSKTLRMMPPAKGSVNVHNDREEWQMWTPDLHQAGSIETFRAILGLILGGIGYPVHWYGFGDDANRATATVQANPTEKSLEHDQATVEELFLTMCQFVTDQAEIAGVYSPADDLEIMLTLPEISKRDISMKAQGFGPFVMALVNAQDAGWITDETAATAFSRLLAEIDVEIDVVEELEAARQEKEENQLDFMANMNGQLQGMLNTNGNSNPAQGVQQPPAPDNA